MYGHKQTSLNCDFALILEKHFQRSSLLSWVYILSCLVKCIFSQAILSTVLSACFKKMYHIDILGILIRSQSGKMGILVVQWIIVVSIMGCAQVLMGRVGT